MLILGRRIGSFWTVTCPDGTVIKITLISTRPHSAQLGIDAPREYEILRDDAVKKEQNDEDYSAGSDAVDNRLHHDETSHDDDRDNVATDERGRYRADRYNRA